MLVELITPKKRSKPFQFYNTWIKDDEFIMAFRPAWVTPITRTLLYQVLKKLKMVKLAAEEWSYSKGNKKDKVREAVEYCHQIIITLQQDPHNEIIQCEVNEARIKLQQLQQSELENLCQCAHVGWIAKGDQGTSFFTRAVKLRSAKNSILCTLDSEGIQNASLNEMKMRQSGTIRTSLHANEDHPHCLI